MGQPGRSTGSTVLFTRLITLSTCFGFVTLVNAQESSAPCVNESAIPQPHFGDMHAHTSYSQDANWRMGTARTTPDDAYHFAKGQAIALPPFNEQGDSVRSTSLARPLDFAVVTDHAEHMNMVRICSDSTFESHEAFVCSQSQLLVPILNKLSQWLPGPNSLCSEETQECSTATLDVWNDTVRAAEQHNDPCTFSTFIGYEWSGSIGRSNMHRNVIFRNSSVPKKPISALDAPQVEQLWRGLESHCLEAGNSCEALSIPHNPNLSDGKMFSRFQSNGEPMAREIARLRSRYEPVVELMQHKGASECAASTLSNDELCDFEILPYPNFAAKYLPFLGEPILNDSRYIREALREGFRLEQALEINPYRLGFIGSTDTHISAPGAVEENRYKGNHGAQLINSIELARKPGLPDRVEQNPGGLAAVFARQNTRDALFEAIKRREAYATSGTRINVRFFAGQEFNDDHCEQANMLENAYAIGVPMGSTLSLRQERQGERQEVLQPDSRSELVAAPKFLVAATQDSGTAESPGTALQQIQIIKGWIDADGNSQERVVRVAGEAAKSQQSERDKQVNLSNCQSTVSGFNKLCATWADPEFDEADQAYYYARVIEQPSCRWQQHICASNKVDCSMPGKVDDGLQACCDAKVPKTIQERAWTSPIWVSK